MSKGCGCSWCDNREYKAFCQSKGDGPEEMPHRPSKKYKKKHKHEMTRVVERITEYDRYTIVVYREYCACGLARECRDWRYKYGGY